MVASEQTQTEITVKKDTNIEKTIRTRDLFIEVLTKIGCQYQLGEGEDTRIFFTFQGENMFADASNESLYVVVWDTYWEHVELYDIDEVSRMRKAINNSNLNSSVTTVYTIDKEGSNIAQAIEYRSMAEKMGLSGTILCRAFRGQVLVPAERHREGVHPHVVCVVHLFPGLIVHTSSPPSRLNSMD